MDGDTIAAIGLAHLADALSGTRSHCIVSEWLDTDGAPVKIYWRPLTADVQQKIDIADGAIGRVCMTVKMRARDVDDKLIFSNTPLESLRRDFDFDVLKSIAYLIATDFGVDVDDKIEGFKKE